MNKEKPINCGCGGEAKIAKKFLMGNLPDVYVFCGNCSIRTGEYYSVAEAIEAWNRAMSGNVQDCAKDARSSERTAKVETYTDDQQETWSVCECGTDVWKSYNYCPECGAKLDWSNDG